MMDKQTAPPRTGSYSDEIVVRYTCAYFDHLRSEFLRVAPTVEAQKLRQIEERLAPIFERRQAGELTWDDVYTFDLEILELLPDEDLERMS